MYLCPLVHYHMHIVVTCLSLSGSLSESGQWGPHVGFACFVASGGLSESRTHQSSSVKRSNPPHRPSESKYASFCPGPERKGVDREQLRRSACREPRALGGAETPGAPKKFREPAFYGPLYR